MYLKSIEHLFKMYRKSIDHLTIIYRSSIDHSYETQKRLNTEPYGMKLRIFGTKR